MKRYALQVLRVNTPITHRRFLEVFDEYTHAVAIEASDRQRETHRNLEDYMNLRRRTSALRTVYNVIQFRLSIPDHVYNHEAIQALYNSATDMVIICNVSVIVSR